ncbi:hypothetical protein IAR55_001106 [Kwoniella newhampshirensis]|uniref:Uncharacterized protein n=1 Tax=Kwoniella newhampshirensis TaxID=1651941 RepID=A0AAW0Z595_9TREE
MALGADLHGTDTPKALPSHATRMTCSIFSGRGDQDAFDKSVDDPFSKAGHDLPSTSTQSMSDDPRSGSGNDDSVSTISSSTSTHVGLDTLRIWIDVDGGQRDELM